MYSRREHSRPPFAPTPILYSLRRRRPSRRLGSSAELHAPALGNPCRYYDLLLGATASRRSGSRVKAKTALMASTRDAVFPGHLRRLGNPDLATPFASPVHSDVPALFISGTLDGRTADLERRGVRRPVHAGRITLTLILARCAHRSAVPLVAEYRGRRCIAFLRDDRCRLGPRSPSSAEGRPLELTSAAPVAGLSPAYHVGHAPSRSVPERAHAIGRPPFEASFSMASATLALHSPR